MQARELKERVRELVGEEPADFYKVKAAILLVLKYTNEVSSDDIRFYIKEFKPSSAIVGSAFQSLVKDEKIRKKGYKQTDVKTSKGRDIAVYEPVE